MIPPMMILCALRVSLKKTTYDMGICCVASGGERASMEVKRKKK